MSDLSYSTVETIVKHIIAGQYNISPAAITGTESFVGGDFEGDSLDYVEIIMAIEDEFMMTIDDEDAVKVKTVREAIDLVANAFKLHEATIVEPERFDPPVVAPKPINYRASIIARINSLVKSEEGFATDDRWLPVKEMLFTGPEKIKGRAKLVRAVKLETINSLPDEKLLDVFTLVVRRHYTMR